MDRQVSSSLFRALVSLFAALIDPFFARAGVVHARSTHASTAA
jgi:hypothetical protein